MKKEMIAPCGVNCAVCAVHLREKRACPGCFIDSDAKPKHCQNCHKKNCAAEKGGPSQLCSGCAAFPCPRLRAFDKRYQKNYGFSPIEALQTLNISGMDALLAQETRRWSCPSCGGLVCAHTGQCRGCGRKIPGR